MSEEKIGRLTLGDMLSDAIGEVQIVNECNETILICSVDPDIASLTDMLKQELLDRQVVRFWIEGNSLVIKIAGVEDAK